MSNKEASLKEKLRQALSSTITVISGDLELNHNKKKEKNSNNLEFLEVENINNKSDFIKVRAETDSSALKKKIF